MSFGSLHREVSFNASIFEGGGTACRDGRSYSVKEMCIALKLNRSSYYKWKRRQQSKSELLNIQITEYVKDFYIHFYNTRRYQKRLNFMSPCEYYFATAA